MTLNDYNSAEYLKNYGRILEVIWPLRLKIRLRQFFLIDAMSLGRSGSQYYNNNNNNVVLRHLTPGCIFPPAGF